MRSSFRSVRSTVRRLGVAATAATLAVALTACGDDDSGQVTVPEEGTGSAYTQAIIESESHDERLISTGGDMVVAVDCDPQIGGTVVNVVGTDLPEGLYVGTFEPPTGVDLQLQVTGPGEAAGASQMTLDDTEYTVTFADLDGGLEFTVLGCPD
jgi:hypothetical protein